MPGAGGRGRRLRAKKVGLGSAGIAGFVVRGPVCRREGGGSVQSARRADGRGLTRSCVQVREHQIWSERSSAEPESTMEPGWSREWIKGQVRMEVDGLVE